MPKLPEDALLGKVRGSLPEGLLFLGNSTRPVEFDLPSVGRVRVYLWTLTRDRSEEGKRPIGEFKIQLILPGQGSKERGSIVTTGAEVTLLLGFSPELGVFSSWESDLYGSFGYSANQQVKYETLLEAREAGWSVATDLRSKEARDEVRVAFSPGNLVHFIRTTVEANRRNLITERRAAWFLAHAPRTGAELPSDPSAPAEELQRLVRACRATLRAERDHRFAPEVRRQFGEACVVCGSQLAIVESAHIIPVGEGGTDDGWNGLCLCPTHHALFDSYAFVIEPETLAVRVVSDWVTFCTEADLTAGIEAVTHFQGRAIRQPASWGDAAFRAAMQGALSQRRRAAGQ